MSDPFPPNQPPTGPGQYATPYADPYGQPYPPVADYYNAAAQPRRPVSTIVLGIIGILYSLYLTLCMGVGLIFLRGSGAFFDWAQRSGGMSAAQRAQIDTQMGDLGVWPYVNGILWILVGIIGWVGAIGSLIGSERGRKALLLFSAAFLALGLIGFAIDAARGFPSVDQQVAAQSAQGGPTIPKGAYVAIGLGCGVVFTAFPIAVLIIYTRERVKQWFKANSTRGADPYPTLGGPPGYGQ